MVCASFPRQFGEHTLLYTPASKPRQVIVLAHGAGAGMDSPVMELLSTGLCEQGFDVVRFEFPYMQQRRRQGIKRPPAPLPQLLQHWQSVLTAVAGEVPLPLIVAGKSMGGRLASLLLADTERWPPDPGGPLLGGVCFGYPFHPPGKPEKTRVAHLQNLSAPLLICQGTRDAFGKPADVATYSFSPQVQVHWLESADHDFLPLRRSGLTRENMVAQAVEAVACQFLVSQQS